MSNIRIDIVFAGGDEAECLRFKDFLANYKILARVHQVLNVNELMPFLSNPSGAEHSRFRPRLVMMDVDSETSIVDTLKKLKADPEFKKVPVVAMGNLKNSEAIQSLYDQGVASYIPKPSGKESYETALESLKQYWLEIVQLPSSEG